jgi:hypothetical protein
MSADLSETNLFYRALFGFLLTISVGHDALAQPAAAHIVGHIDRVVVDDGGAHIKGWACQEGQSESITVHIYADSGANNAVRQTLILAGKADLEEEAAVDKVCQDPTGRKHRFDTPLPGSSLLKFHGMALYAHGIRVVVMWKIPPSLDRARRDFLMPLPSGANLRRILA